MNDIFFGVLSLDFVKIKGQFYNIGYRSSLIESLMINFVENNINKY